MAVALKKPLRFREESETGTGPIGRHALRALAQRSAEAAKAVNALVTASTGEVDSGAELVARTGLVLKDIIINVAEIDSLVRQISGSSQEQAIGLAEINVAIDQMDQIVQQNETVVEHSAAAAHPLKSESEELSSIVGRFRIAALPNVA